MEILGKAQAVPADFQAADSLLKGFLVGLADTHNLAYRPHLGAQPVLGILKLFKGPSGKLDYHIIPSGHILVQGAVNAAGNLVQGQAGRQHRGHQGDREACGLAGQGGGTGGSGVNLNDHNAVAHRVMGKLHVGAADNLYLLHNFICLLLQTLLQLFGNRQHGCGTEGISGVYPERVNIFDKAHGNHVALGVPDYLKLQLLPA